MGQPSSSRETPASPRWTVESRGSFLFGTCLTCGFRSPGRRASYSVEDDMQAHELLCESVESLHPASVADATAES